MPDIENKEKLMDIFSKVSTFFNNNETDIYSFWERLVNIDSASNYLEGVNRAAELVYKFYLSHGISAQLLTRKDAGSAIVATVCGQGTGKPVIFVGHYDTVWGPGTATKRPFTIRDGKAYGPGVFDMKAGIIMISYIALALQKADFKERPIKIVLASDEEIMHEYSDQGEILERESRGCVAAFCFEGCYPEPKHPIARKGVVTLAMEIGGVPAHAGKNPEDGRSAILEAAHKIQAMEALTDLKEYVTVTVGTISGGTFPNTTPDRCVLGIDVRGISEEQIESTVQKIQAIASKNIVPGTSARIARKGSMPSMANLPGNNALLELSKRCSRELGLVEPVGIISGGASDAAYASKVGVPVLDHMGVQGNYLHTEQEYAIVSSLLERMKLATLCVLRLKEIKPYAAKS
jgi:glutamate carboxypeptidase